MLLLCLIVNKYIGKHIDATVRHLLLKSPNIFPESIGQRE